MWKTRRFSLKIGIPKPSTKISDLRGREALFIAANEVLPAYAGIRLARSSGPGQTRFLAPPTLPLPESFGPRK